MNVTTINITQYTADALTTSLNATIIDEFKPLLFLLFGLLIIITGQYIRNWAFIISGGVWFIGLIASNFFTDLGLGFNSILFFSIIAILTILHGISNFYDQKEPNTVKLNDD